ncbi:MAG: PAS domain S-box protein [Chloroflexi bacterium]|nr:PAS domain S-box protein [Chloroflexota bacterium]OJV97179.1 MAG: hypothetical protein BGO39_19580 [Chloroflexi bacterium 54-19]
MLSQDYDLHSKKELINELAELKIAYDELKIRYDKLEATVQNSRYEKDKAIEETLDRISNCYLAIDNNGRFTFLNKAAEKWLFRSKAELLGKSIWEVFPDAVDGPFFANYHKAITEQREIEFEDFYPPLNSWFRVRAYPSPNGITAIFDNINELKKAEAERQKSLELYRILARTFPNSTVFLYDQDLRFLIVEGTALQKNGLKKELIEGKTLFETLSPAQVAYYEPKYRAALRGETIVDERYVELYGRTYSNTYLPIRNEQGQIFAGMIVSYEITERKKTQEALQHSETKYKTLFQVAPFGVCVTDSTGKIIEVNETLEKLLGLTLNSENNWTIYDERLEVFRPDGTRWPASEFPKVLSLKENETIYGTEMGIKKPDGTISWLMVSAAPIPLENYGISAVFVDITERKKMEQALRLSEDRFRLVIKSTNDAILDWNIATSEMWWNENFYDFYKYQPSEVDFSLSWLAEHIHPEDRPRIAKQMYEAFRNGTVYVSDECRFLRGDGTYAYVLGRGYIVRDSEGRAVRMIGSLQDLTERKKALETLLKTEEQLRQSQKMEAVGRLAGGVAHDFNNILTGIMGYCELIQLNLEPTNPIAKDLEQIQNGVNRAAALTQQLLAYSRKQVLQQKPLDLNKLILNFNNLLKRVIGEDIELVLHLDTDLQTILADTTQLEQVLLNLSVNARDAMPGGGKLIFETKNITLEEASKGELPEAIPGSYVMLAVTDTGHGMDEITRSQIFEPFFTTKEPGKGTGLGLSTVYGIIHQSKGFIEVSTRVGGGTTFKIFLPVLSSPDKPKRASATARLPEKSGVSQGQAAGEQPATILLVEDDKMLREIVQLVLELNNYRVLSVARPEEGAALFPEHADQINLVITDLIMPGMNGQDLIKKIQETQPDVKVIYISGYTHSLTKNTLNFELEGKNFVGKPFSPKDLLEKVKEVLNDSCADSE